MVSAPPKPESDYEERDAALLEETIKAHAAAWRRKMEHDQRRREA